MTDRLTRPVRASRALRWEAHACLPLHPEASLEPLLRFAEAGVHYVSINVGMDLNPLEQVMTTLRARGMTEDEAMSELLKLTEGVRLLWIHPLEIA